MMKTMWKRIAVFGALCACLSCGSSEELDVWIQGGNLIDGTGTPGRVGDVGIKDGRMVLVEPGISIDATQVVDASGLVVAPGFVDVHNHTDVFIANRAARLNEGFIRQGVTTIVGGPDGAHTPNQIRDLIADFEDYGVGTNVAFYVGHNGVRLQVMEHDQRRAPTDEELAEMKALVKEGMELGALGLSTGLMYEPGLFSNTEEVVALALEVKPFAGVYDSHIRNPVHAWIASNEEAITIGERTGIGAKLGHIKEVGLHNAGLVDEMIAIIDAARAGGQNVVSDQYPYDAAAGRLTLTDILVFTGDPRRDAEMRLDPDFDIKTKLRDPDERAKLKEASENGVDGGFAWIKAIGYSSLRIVSSKDYPQLVGKYISELAEERNTGGFEVLADLVLEADHSVEVKGGIQEEAVQKLLVQPWNMIASDGAYADSTTTAQGHPRSTGTFPRVLGHYVREKKLLSLTEAIRKMTCFPADFVGLRSRGRLAEGLPADITIFDPETIIDRSTYEEPNLMPEGVVHVFVNGVAVLQDGELTGEAPGKFLPREMRR